MALSRPWMRATPSPIEMTDPTSLTATVRSKFSICSRMILVISSALICGMDRGLPQPLVIAALWREPGGIPEVLQPAATPIDSPTAGAYVGGFLGRIHRTRCFGSVPGPRPAAPDSDGTPVPPAGP